MATGTVSNPPAIDTLRSQAQGLMPEVISLRRAIHRQPEVGLDLPLTQAKVLEALDGLDLEITTGKAQSSVVATLRGGSGEGPTLVLRGDMDALPMPEDSDEAFASEIEGAMHACGHDTHVAMLAGAARLLHSHRDDFNGTIKFFFQPGEEGYGGAAIAIEEGLLDGVDAGFALHITPNAPAGSLGTKSGPLLSAADFPTVTIIGQGGHASAPHLASDPVPAAAEIITAFQTRLTRSIDAFDPAVLTITMINGGTANNVIPESVTLAGTLRTFSPETRARMHRLIRDTASGIAEVHGCKADVSIEEGYPVTVNDGAFVDWVSPILSDVAGDRGFQLLDTPIMAAEDWSYVLQQVPGAMAFLGVCPEGQDPSHAHSCHSNYMRVNEDALINGVTAHAAVALNYMFDNR